MEIFKSTRTYDFVSKIPTAVKISVLLIVISLGSLIYNGGPNWGVEFTGGTEVQVKFPKGPQTDDIRNSLKDQGYEAEAVQQFGLASDHEYLISFSPKVVSFDQIQSFKETLNKVIESTPEFSDAQIQRIDYIGPKIGKELVQKAVLSILIACVGILIYLIFRFELGFAVGAVIALFHDTIITLGAISLTNKEFTLAIVAALLTVIGYSVNDTIVIFDRIRENIAKSLSKNFGDIVNEGVSQTLSRTILTGVTVFIVLLPLFFLGGAVIHDFAFTLIVGVIIGTYSSIFVASAFVLYWRKRKAPDQT
ncbi:MAG: protein translocase subunit SecF [Thermodesulfobacteriota bacterium]